MSRPQSRAPIAGGARHARLRSALVSQLLALLPLLALAVAGCPLPLQTTASSDSPSPGSPFAVNPGATLGAPANANIQISQVSGDPRSVNLSAQADSGDTLTYSWSAPFGKLSSPSGQQVEWTAPGSLPASTPLSITVRVTDSAGQSTVGVRNLTVRPDGTLVDLYPSSAPTLGSVTGNSASGTGITLQANATDPLGAGLTCTWLPLRGTINGQGGAVTTQQLSVNWGVQPPIPDADTVLLTLTNAVGDVATGDVFLTIDSAGNVTVDGQSAGTLAGISGPVTTVPSVPANTSLPAGVSVTGVTLTSAASATIDAPPPAGLADPEFTTQVQLAAAAALSDGTTSSLIVWSSSDPQEATVNWQGLVTGTPGAPAGSTTITAASFLDPSQIATLSIQVLANGQAEVTVQ